MYRDNRRDRIDALKAGYACSARRVLESLLPGGRVIGKDYVVRNPKRKDDNAGSFRIDIATGKFIDKATGDKGGDIIALIRYVENCDFKTSLKRLDELTNFSSLAGNSFKEPLIAATKTSSSKEKKYVDFARIWNNSVKAGHPYLETTGFPYLKAKGIGIGNAGVNIYKSCPPKLVIPLTYSFPNNEADLQLKGFQYIYADGKKVFPTQMGGLFHICSSYDLGKDIVVICEGFATGRSIVEACLDLFVVCALSTNNLVKIALRISELLPDSKIVIAADNDGPGLNAASEAKQGLQSLGSDAEIIYPTDLNDFNDEHMQHGLSVVSNYFKELKLKKDKTNE